MPALAAIAGDLNDVIGLEWADGAVRVGAAGWKATQPLPNQVEELRLRRMPEATDPGARAPVLEAWVPPEYWNQLVDLAAARLAPATEASRAGAGE